jgi:hypothetical protein
VLLAQYCAGHKIETNEIGGTCNADGEERGVYRVFWGKPEEKRPKGGPRRRWENILRWIFREVGCGGMDGIGLAQDRDR